jgi:hypothetical protein
MEKPKKHLFFIFISFCTLLVACVKTTIEEKSNAPQEIKSVAPRISATYSKHWQYTINSADIAIYQLRPESWPAFASNYPNTFEVRRYFKTRNNHTAIYDLIYWRDGGGKPYITFTVFGGWRMGSLKFENGRLTPYNCITCSSMGQPPMLSYEEWLANWCAQMPSSLLCQPSETGGGGTNNNCCVLESIAPDGSPGSCLPSCAGGGGGGVGNTTALGTLFVENIDNQLHDSCATIAFNTLNADTLKSAFTSAFNAIFTVGPKVNFHIKDVPVAITIISGSNDTVPAKSTPIYNPNAGTLEWYTELDTNKLRGKPIEFIASVIAHEMAHAIAFWKTLVLQSEGDYRIFLEPSMQHYYMFYRSTEMIRDLLMKAYNLSSTNATALALGGLDDALSAEYDNAADVITWHQIFNTFATQHYNTDLTSARAIRNNFKNGTLGTPCH